DARAGTLLDELGTRALLAAPIVTNTGEPLGSIVLGARDGTRFAPDDVAFAEDLARRVAVAAERSTLFASVTRFKATVDASADAVYMFDPASLRLTYVNRGGGALLGHDPADLTGRNILEVQPGVPEASFRRRLDELKTAPGHAASYVEMLAHASGRQVPVDVFLQEVTLADGSRATILTARDISERIDVQARLARIAGDERRQAAELRAVIQ